MESFYESSEKPGEGKSLFLPENNPPLGQVVRRELHFHAVPRQDADEMLAHFSRDDPQDLLVAAIQLELEHRVGQRGGHGRFHLNRLTFGHSAILQTRHRIAQSSPVQAPASPTQTL